MIEKTDMENALFDATDALADVLQEAVDILGWVPASVSGAPVYVHGEWTHLPTAV